MQRHAVVIAKNFPQAELLLFDEDGASTQEVLNGKRARHHGLAAHAKPRSRGATPETLTVIEGDLFDPRGEGFVMRKGDPGCAQLLQQLDRAAVAHRLAARASQLLVRH